MKTRAANLPLFTGLLVSLLLHALVIVPGLMAAAQSSRAMTSFDAQFQAQDVEPPETPPPPPDLGIDEPMPSTLTWVGHREYEEHLAHLADIEQAAFTDQPISGGAPTAPRQASEEQPTPREEDRIAAGQETPEDPGAPPAPKQVHKLTMAELIRKMFTQLPGPEADQPETGAAEPAEPEPTPEQPTQAAQEADAPPAPPTPHPEPAERADKVSDAFSTIDVPLDQIKLGKPLAAQGLELKPSRPDFSIMTRLTASPGNPLVEIRFNREGKPSKAIIVQSSGDDRVDHTLKASLYRWKAAGKGLEELEGEQTIDVRLRIILNANAP